MFALLSGSVGGFCGCRCSRNWAWLLRGKYARLRVTVTCDLLAATCSRSRSRPAQLGRVRVHYKLMRHFAHNLSGFGFASCSVFLLSLSFFLVLLLTRVIFHAVFAVAKNRLND